MRSAAAVWACLILVLTSVLSACFSGEGTPVTGPDKASCAAGYPPSDVRRPADTCGVRPLNIPKNPFNASIPRDPAAGAVDVDLYIEGDHTCGIGSGLCAVDDNRPFVARNGRDPHASPTRNRVHMVLDFRSQMIRIQVSPSCRIHAVDVPVAGPVGFNGKKECFASNDIGQGTDYSLTADGGAVTVKLNVLQTAYYASPLKLGQIENTFLFEPHSDGSVDFAVQGTNFPDLAVIRHGVVACADPANHITAAVLPAIGPNERRYNCRLPRTVRPTPTLHPTPQQATGCPKVACGSENGVTLIITSVHRSRTNNYGDDLTADGRFFVRMGVRVINYAAPPTTVDNSHFGVLDARHIMGSTSDEGFGSKCGLSGDGDPGITLAKGADVVMPESLCFEPHGSLHSSFVVEMQLDDGGEVHVSVP